jgi:hypothetical protein
MELTPEENLALVMIRNTPSLIQSHFKGQVAIPMEAVARFYETLARNLRLSEDKRAENFEDAGILEPRGDQT